MKKTPRINSLALVLLLITTAVFNLGVARAQEGKIVPYVPTPQEVVDRMLELAEVKKGDVVYDLGSGDGRIVVTAAKKYGIRAIGFEIDPERLRNRQKISRRPELVIWSKFANRTSELSIYQRPRC